MTPRQENSIERSVGRIEAQNEALAENFKSLTEAVMSLRDAAEPMRADIAELKRRADLWAAVTEKFNALEQAIHDGKLAAKFGTKGFVLGLTVAGGAVGATAATGVKWVVASIWGGP
jgi:chromosome segregation ATPase